MSTQTQNTTTALAYEDAPLTHFHLIAADIRFLSSGLRRTRRSHDSAYGKGRRSCRR